MTNILFETKRLYMRMPVIADAQAMQNIKEANWQELQKWMSWAADDHLPMDATLTFIKDIVPADHAKGGCMLFAFHKHTHDLVMVGGLNATSEAHVYGTGYWGNINYLGQGYATEMTKGTIDYAFNHHGAKRIEISYYEGNGASRRVIEKCRFEFVETLPKSHKSFATGELLDEHCYALKKERWQEQHVS